MVINGEEEQSIDPTASTRWDASGTTLHSTHKNTFKRSHIGKYVRADGTGGVFPVTLGNGQWIIITGYESDSRVKAASLVTTFLAITGTSLPVKQVPGTHKIYIDAETTYDTFASTDVGRWITMGFGESRIYGKIYLYVDSKKVKVQLDTTTPLIRDPTDSSRLYNEGQADWFRLGAWSTTTGWPSVISFHEQRLWFGRTAYEPQTLWSSVIDDFTNFQPSDLDSTVLETDAMTYTIASNKIESIRWMVSGPVLMIGTDSGEWQARAATSTSEPISPSNVSITPQTYFGSKLNALAYKIGAAVVYAQRHGRKIRELSYSFELDTHVSRNISVISEHLTRKNNSRVKQIVFQQEPHQMVWVVNEDGMLSAFTYDKDQEVIAWCRMIPGGSFNSGTPVVESIATIPGVDQDMVYMIVKRTVNSTTVRHIEMIDVDYFPEGSIGLSDQYFVDAGRKYSFSSPVSSVGGFLHLIGETLQVLADGTYIGTKVASGGVVILGASYSKLSIGYQMNSVVEILPLESGGQVGVAQGKQKRFHRIVARLWKALRFKHGSDEAALTAETVGTTFFTGDHPFPLEQRPDLRAQFLLKVDEPVAFTLLALMPEGKTRERQ
jgi:hypothetical protein